MRRLRRSQRRRVRRDVDMSKFVWEASRKGERGQDALKVLQDTLLERYGPQFEAAQRYAKKKYKTDRTSLGYVVLFVPKLTRRSPILSTFGQLPSLKKGDKVAVVEDSGENSGRRGTVVWRRYLSDPHRAGAQYDQAWVNLTDEQGRSFLVLARRLRNVKQFETEKQQRFSPFRVMTLRRIKHQPAMTIVVWDTADGYDVHHFTSFAKTRTRRAA